jgi:arylformamidase
MEAFFDFNNTKVIVDFSKPMDISIPIRNGIDNVNCFFAPYPEFSPLVDGSFIGSTIAGGPVNFYNIKMNPHGNGTHTECIGHISKETYSINTCLKTFHFWAKLITIYPTKQENGDRIITVEQLREYYNREEKCNALIIRTMPNDDFKLTMNYSGSNPPFFHPDALVYLREMEIKHLVTDLPSVDKEKDGGKLFGHKSFWNYPKSPETERTITELVYIENKIKDNYYLLNIQIASLELDASPSKIVLYDIQLDLPQ